MLIRKLRVKNGWTQEQLANFSGLNIRTIQRIERSQGSVSLESLKSLAAVFEISVNEIQQELEMTNSNTETKKDTAEEKKALEEVRDIKGFYQHLIIFAVIGGIPVVAGLIINPESFWIILPLIGWGIGVLIHGLNVFESVNIFGPKWEKRKVEKRLGRKL